MFTKRELLKATASLGLVSGFGEAARAASFGDIAPGPFKPDWEALKAQ